MSSRYSNGYRPPPGTIISPPFSAAWNGACTIGRAWRMAVIVTENSADADNTLADAILDRLMHNAHRLLLKGESMRKILSQLTEDEHLG